jgi:trimeric autotransporter adhesin
VSFYQADGTTLIANAYLLFATSTQINALVPSGLLGTQQAPNTSVKIVVNLTSGGVTTNSTKFSANTAAQDPGVFTTTSSGQGQGAVLLSDFSVNSNANPGLVGKSTVLIYVTGVGVPNSTSANSNAAKSAFPTTCVSTANYMATINALPGNANWTTVDGAVIQSNKLQTNILPPCMATAKAVTVTIGGQAATVSYAGWVGDSVAGLYQINALVPAKANPSVANPPAVTAVPVVVTVGGVNSQTGVTMFVK